MPLSTPPASRLYLGTAQLGGHYGVLGKVGEVSQDRVDAVLDAAVAAEFGGIDTARAYRDSESRIGRWLQSLPAPPKQAVVTKLPRFTGHPEAEPRASFVGRQWERSVAALGGRRPDTLLLHDVSDLQMPEIRMELDRLAGEGIRVGASLYRPDELERLLEWSSLGAVQIPLNLLDRRFGESGLLDDCAKRGVHVFARSLFLQGLLLQPSDALPFKVKDLAPAVTRLRDLVPVEDLYRLCLAAGLGTDGVGHLVLGAEHPDQIVQAATAIKGAEELIDQADAVSSEILPLVPDGLVDPRNWS